MGELDIDLDQEVVDLIGAFNQYIRWNSKNNEGNLDQETILIHVIGGDFNLLEPIYQEIISKDNELRLQLDTTDDVPMRVASEADFYSQLRHIMDREIDVKRGTCGTWVHPEDLFANLTDLINYKEYMFHHQEREAVQLIQICLPSWVLDNKHRTRIFFEDFVLSDYMSDALIEARFLRRKFLRKRWVHNAEDACAAGLVDFKALLALEKELLHYQPNIFDDADRLCIANTLERDMAKTLPLDTALINFNVSLSDSEMLRAIFNEKKVKSLEKQHKSRTMSISRSKLAVLSLSGVRFILTGYTSNYSCLKCTCNLQHRSDSFKDSVDRIQSKLLPHSRICKHNSVDYTNWLNDGYSDLEDFMVQQKQSLMKDIYRIEGIDNIFEVFNTRLKYYYRKPYTGIPFTHMPAKHALWWIASHFFHYEQCEQFNGVQILREYLERYSVIYYFADMVLLEQCGLLPFVKPLDSFIMANLKCEIIKFDKVRRFNFDEVCNKMLYSENGKLVAIDDNTYERILKRNFEYLRQKELPLDTKPNEKLVHEYVKYWLKGNYEKLADEINEEMTSRNVLKCGTCEYHAYFKVIRDYDMLKAMNFADGRIFPFSYEQEIYFEARRSLMDIEESRSGLQDCNDSAAKEFEFYKSNVVRMHKTISGYNMKDPSSAKILKDANLNKRDSSYLSLDIFNIRNSSIVNESQFYDTVSRLLNDIGN